MPASDPIELIASLLTGTIKMVITPTEYFFQSGVIGDAIYMSWLFLS